MSFLVSIHAPLRGATLEGPGFWVLQVKFQSTHPCGVRHFLAMSHRAWLSCFNPRTPAGCDVDDKLDVLCNLGVSIHAPLRGATIAALEKQAEADKVSIHAPLRGATLDDRLHRNPHSCFNPRTPAGCDGMVRRPSYQFNQFQSTHPCGVRLSPIWHLVPNQEFQSTHPCGVRQFRLSSCASGGEFQSTHPCGVRRPRPLAVKLRSSVSIHAPLRGATVRTQAQALLDRGFNPRTPAGCDLSPLYHGLQESGFNPRTPAGCDLEGVK